VAALAVGAVFLGAALWAFPVRDWLLQTLEWTRSLGAWGPVFVAIFYAVACLFFLPGSVLTMGAGFLFGLAVGMLSAWTGACIGACAAFLTGRTLARDWVARKVAGNHRFLAVDQAVGSEGFKIVLLLRLSPVFPFNFLNYALGLTKVSFGSYALATVIGMIPGAFLYVYIGSAARSLAEAAAGGAGETASRVFFVVGLAFTVAAVLFVTRVARKSLAEAEASLKDAGGERSTRRD
jgi:uncharacterized membrane protein YdjX (TVP38/TMEM64 family)